MSAVPELRRDYQDVPGDDDDVRGDVVSSFLRPPESVQYAF